MHNSPFVSIIIVTWNSKVHLPRCLNALSSQTMQNFDVVLVDNGSTDGSVDNLAHDFPNINLCIERLNSNFGFASANNRGARLARGRWLALLNADAFPEADWLENLLQAAEEHPDFSCFSSRQVQANNPDFLDGTGDGYHVSGLAWRRNIGYPANQFDISQEEVFSPCAAAALYLRDAFLDVGGFDEDFFSYYEDVDLGFRLRLDGYRCLYVPEATVKHVGSTSVGAKSDFVFYHTHRNLVWTFLKNMPTRLLLRSLPAHLLANLIYLLYYSLTGRGRVLWRAKWDAIWALPSILKKRKEIQKGRTVTDKDLLNAMERGWFQPYIRSFRYHSEVAKSIKEEQ